MVYVARYLSKIEGKKISFKESLLPLWMPVFLILTLILLGLPYGSSQAFKTLPMNENVQVTFFSLLW